MYEAIRQRAPHSSKLAGVSATAMCLGLATWAILSGFGEQIAKVIQERITVVIVPPTPTDPPEPVETFKVDIPIDLPIPLPPTTPLDDFRRDEPPPITVTGKTDDADVGVGTLPPPPVRKWPVMRTTEKPEYPPTEIRGLHEGVTGLSLCVGANGRVTSASLASSSGFTRLDEAALKWVRGVRFAPGTMDGAAQAMCGHKVTYDWKLEDARR